MVEEDLYNEEYGPYGFLCKDYDPDMTGEPSILITDAWGHELIATGRTYGSYQEWYEDVMEAIDDDEFVDESYLNSLMEYEELVWDALLNSQLFSTTSVQEGEKKDMKKNLKEFFGRKKPVNTAEDVKNRFFSLTSNISDSVPDGWYIDFSEEGGVWWACKEEEGIVEEFDTQSDAVHFALEYEGLLI